MCCQYLPRYDFKLEITGLFRADWERRARSAPRAPYRSWLQEPARRDFRSCRSRPLPRCKKDELTNILLKSGGALRGVSGCQFHPAQGRAAFDIAQLDSFELLFHNLLLNPDFPDESNM
jgi:hypothetical protein